ncbi:hypothetical protein E5A73_16060 [Sphingomonas gei]|uniref:DUF2059 domain-containing protein n=1 Tax=Sphingomonas gei TaxID=1395960 RepID=A0A4S1X8F9_9SPHN|nr:DUF6683 family protein [Sphingomonas gei]TGX52308.1 hypothetical protein E5A73_16060 [Sphingomonas gei]
MRHVLTALCLVLLTSAPPASAQDFPSIGSQYVDFGASMAAVGQMNNVMGAAVRNRRSDRVDSPRAAATTRYRPSPTVSARVRTQFADFIARADPAHSEGLRKFVQQNDLLGAWEQHVAGDGLRRGDVADAMTAYWVQNWQIANKVAFASRAQVQSVRAQVAGALAGSPGFARLGDAARQELAETFMLNFIAQGSAFSDAAARRDAGATRRLSDAAAARFRKDMNLDLRALRLTEAGLIG